MDGIYKAAWLYETYAGAGGDAVLTGAALQLAIWEVLYEDTGSYNVLSGSTHVINNSWNSAFFNDGVAALANNYLTGVQTDKSITGTWWNAKDQRNQDLIGPYVATPEPTTMVAGAMLLLPFLASTLRRKLK